VLKIFRIKCLGVLQVAYYPITSQMHPVSTVYLFKKWFRWY